MNKSRSRHLVRSVRLAVCSALLATGIVASPADGLSAPEDGLGRLIQYVPLHTFYSPSRNDFFTTSDPQWTRCPSCPHILDYVWFGLEGYVLSAPPALAEELGYTRLYHWYNHNNRSDNFLTSNPEWAGEVGDRREHDGIYELFRFEGYVRKAQVPHAAPLFGWYMHDSDPNRRDNATSAGAAWGGSTDVNQGAYRQHRLEGFLDVPDLAITGAEQTSAPRVSVAGDYLDVDVRFLVENRGGVAADMFKVRAHDAISTRSPARFSPTKASEVCLRDPDAGCIGGDRKLGGRQTITVEGTVRLLGTRTPRSVQIVADSCLPREIVVPAGPNIKGTKTYCRVLESNELNNSAVLQVM